MLRCGHSRNLRNNHKRYVFRYLISFSLHFDLCLDLSLHFSWMKVSSSNDEGSV